jgi:uncharacterized protein (TIGR03790 family)
MRWFLTGLLAFSVVAGAAAELRAELSPDELAILAMRESEQSRELAEYYAAARGVPKSHIFLLEGKPGGTMSRADWQRQARPAIRAWLAEGNLEKKIRCFVTCWDVPLRIGPQSNDLPEVLARQEFFAQSRADLIERLGDSLRTLDGLAPAEGLPQRPPLAADTKLAELTAQLNSATQAARERLRTIESEDQKKEAGTEFQRVFFRSVGLIGMLQTMARRPDKPGLDEDAARQVEFFRGRLQGLTEALLAMGSLPESLTRDEVMLRLVLQTGGLLGAIGCIDQQEQQLARNETACALDSELSLLLWPDYPLDRWTANLLSYRVTVPPPAHRKTLMVSRLEAPTFALAKNLVDTAIATEKTGLSGKVYLDARGFQFDPATDRRGSHAEYDQSLRDLAARLKEHTKLEVVLDDKAELFQEGDCPDAALYCGWYSLAKYIDAFQWQPGAVGYHLASAEATTLRVPGSKVWCNAMLEDGICATLGPVQEPYLVSFPLPDDFFSLLLTGRYTLVEVYYRTLPFNSWAMVLVGDPLYNPFKQNPQLAEDALPERMTKQTSAEP